MAYRPGVRRYGAKVAKNSMRYIYSRAAYDAAKYGYNRAKGYIKPQPKRKRKSYGYDRKARAEIKNIKGKLNDMNQLVHNDMGKLVYRLRSTGTLSSAVNQQNQAQIIANSTSTIETVLAQLRYYDPSNPSTLVTASGVTGTFSKDFLITRSYYKLVVQNNYQVPCHVTIYLCRPKEDTSIGPQTAFTEGLTDVGNPSANSTLVYLTDSEIFQDLWKVENSEKKYLQPGEFCTLAVGDKKYTYDPSVVDSHALSYQSQYKAAVYVLRVEGPLCHDSVADQQGTGQGGVDYQLNRTFEVEYQAGAQIHYIVSSDTSDTFTNSAVCSNKPVSDNQSYSLA